MDRVTRMGATKFRVDLRNVIEHVQAGRGPVLVTIYGEEAAVLLSIREWQQLQNTTAPEERKEESITHEQ